MFLRYKENQIPGVSPDFSQQQVEDETKIDEDDDTEVVKLDQGFWNLSKVGFLKDKVDEGFDPVEEVKDAEKQKWKHTSIIPKSKMIGGRKKQNFRSIVSAAALPIFSESINMIYLNKAQAVWSLNKIMGQDYMGDD